MTLKRAIEQWDGKSAEDIGSVYQEYGNSSSLCSQLIDLMAEPELQNGATWLLKRHLEQHAGIVKEHLGQVFELLSSLVSWQSRLHILQVFEHLPIAATQVKSVELFLRRCLMDSNKFVRAWSYHGFYHLQAQYPHYQDEVKSFFAMAMSDEAASVKARIRNIAKGYRFDF